MDTPTPPSERWLNIPNLITLTRLIVLMPLFSLLVLVWHENLWAFVVLVALGATDWLDGFLARRWKQVTRFGAVLDPIADRVSQVVVCLTLVLGQIAPLWMALVLVITDVLVGILVLAYRRSSSMTVTRFGKARTALLMVGLPLLLFAHSGLITSDVLATVAYWFVAIGCLAHAVAGIQYARQIVRGGVGSRPSVVEQPR